MRTLSSLRLAGKTAFINGGASLAVWSPARAALRYELARNSQP